MTKLGDNSIDIEENIENKTGYRINRSNQFNISICCSSILIIFILLSVFYSIIPLVNYYNLEEQMCFVSGVEYPTELPTFENSENWIQCDCGERCISWTPCVKIYINTSDEIVLDNFDDNYNECTFTDYSCPLNENVQYLNQELQEVIELADSYINSSFTCYYNQLTDVYSINNTIYEFTIYLLLSITLIFLIYLVVIIYRAKN